MRWLAVFSVDAEAGAQPQLAERWQYPRGVATDPETQSVYVANTGSNTVSVISERTNTVTATVPVGVEPVAVVVNRQTDTIYVTNFVDATMSVINGMTNKVTTTIRVGFQPRGVAADRKTNRVYAANFGGNTVSVIASCLR